MNGQHSNFDNMYKGESFDQGNHIFNPIGYL